MSTATARPRSKVPARTTPAINQVPATTAPVQDRILLRGVPWKVYLRLREPDENNGIRMTYDQGDLELMTLSRIHERYSELWGRAVVTWTEELRIPIDACGSMTWKDPQLKKGLESDKCLYIENEAAIRGKDEIDLDVGPPPDLAIEVEVSSQLLPKLPIYKASRVPEVWQWRHDKVRILLLNADGEYDEAADSRCLPGFPFAEVIRRLESLHAADNNALFRRFRAKIRTMLKRKKRKS